MFAEAMKVTAIYDKYDVNAYLMGTGLSVAPEYRRQGIAIELLSVRWVNNIHFSRNNDPLIIFYSRMN